MYDITLAFSNILLETFVPNLVSVTRPSLQILREIQTGVFVFSGLLVNPLQKKIAITPQQMMTMSWNSDQ